MGVIPLVVAGYIVAVVQRNTRLFRRLLIATFGMLGLLLVIVTTERFEPFLNADWMVDIFYIALLYWFPTFCVAPILAGIGLILRKPAQSGSP